MADTTQRQPSEVVQMSELLPCPFCGGEPERYDDHDFEKSLGNAKAVEHGWLARSVLQGEPRSNG